MEEIHSVSVLPSHMASAVMMIRRRDESGVGLLIFQIFN